MALANYVPNIASLQAGFPAETPPPALLLAFAQWLAERPRSSLGLFHLESEPLPATFAAHDDATAALRKSLGIFMKVAPATRLALWMRPGRAPAVVSLAPRELREVAPDFASFLGALSRGASGVAALDRDADDSAEHRAALAHWLEAQKVAPPREPPLEAGSFARWFEATVSAAKAGQVTPLSAAKLPEDLFGCVDPWLGHLTEERALQEFFASLGVDLDAIREPEQLRFLARPAEGAAFSIVWPWEHPSEWRDAEFPPVQRHALELRRVRMFWSVEVFVVPQQRGEHALATYAGVLPFGIEPGDDVDALERKLGSPILGRFGVRTWDYPARRRTLTAGLNEGVWIRDDLPRGALTWLRWQVRQSV